MRPLRDLELEDPSREARKQYLSLQVNMRIELSDHDEWLGESSWRS